LSKILNIALPIILNYVNIETEVRVNIRVSNPVWNTNYSVTTPSPIRHAEAVNSNRI